MTLRLDRAIAALALVAMCSPALAQQPTQAQISAIRSNCRSDFMSNCSGVRPGGADALRCLKDHMAQLSPGCHAAVSAVTPAAAPKVAEPPAGPAPTAAPAAPPEPAPAAAAAPTEPAATPPAAPAAQPSTATAPTAPAPSKRTRPAPQPNRAATAAPASPAPATQPTSLGPIPPLRPALRLMIVRACRVEARTVCGGAPAGGGRIVDCLAEHGDALSPRCREAILSVK
jgi:hypothetical protein